MNRVEITGGLTRDPELVYLEQSGAAVLDLTVAVNGARYDYQSKGQVVTTIYVAVKVWASLAEDVAEMDLRKGDEVAVVGELEQRVQEKRSGDKESKTHVRAVTVSAVRKRGQSAAPRRAPAASSDPGPTAPPGGWGEEEPF